MTTRYIHKCICGCAEYSETDENTVVIWTEPNVPIVDDLVEDFEYHAIETPQPLSPPVAADLEDYEEVDLYSECGLHEYDSILAITFHK